MESLYQEIIKKGGLFFRGVELGASISEVQKVEGTKNNIKSGINPSIHYSWETGEMEEIDLYYGLNSNDKVNRVKLLFYSYPDFYYKQITGGDFLDFEQLVYKNKIQDYSKVSNDLLAQILSSLANNLGEPVEQHKDEVFDKGYQNFKRWIWFKERNNSPLRLSLTTYLDDTDSNSIKWVISLLLSENTTP